MEFKKEIPMEQPTSSSEEVPKPIRLGDQEGSEKPQESQLQVNRPIWATESFWLEQSDFWKEAWEFDLGEHCRLLAKQWAVFKKAFSTPRNARLISNASIIAYEECKARKALYEKGELQIEHGAAIYTILTALYCKYKLPTVTLPFSPSNCSGYQQALDSAKTASWKGAKRDFSAMLEQNISDHMAAKRKLSKSKKPLTRVRRKNDVVERLGVFLAGNWIECHLWLMSLDACSQFVEKCSRQRGVPYIKNIGNGLLQKTVKRYGLVFHSNPPIIEFKPDGTPKIRNGFLS